MNTTAIKRLRHRFPIALLCLYAPYAWLILPESYAGTSPLTWLISLLILPGLPALLIPGVHGQSTSLEFLAIGVLTALILGLVALLLTGGRTQAIATLITVGLLSCFNCAFANSVLWY